MHIGFRIVYVDHMKNVRACAVDANNDNNSHATPIDRSGSMVYQLIYLTLFLESRLQYA